MGRKYLLRTLGCKVNQYESQQLREILEANGLCPAGPDQRADLVVVNSCAVTATASAKTRRAVRRASPGGGVPVLVVGCGAAADAERLRRIPGVVGVWSHQAGIAHQLRNFLVHRLGSGPESNAAAAGADPACGDAQLRTGGDDGWTGPGWPTPGGGSGHQARQPTRINHRGRGPDRRLSLAPISVAPSSAEVNEAGLDDRPIHRFSGRQRAFLKVQDGCDAGCTYCIIPRLRPRLHFKPIETAVREAQTLVRAGHREIVLTGIYLGAYGRSTAARRRAQELTEAHGPQSVGSDRPPLPELVDALARVHGLARLRLSSLEPGDVTDDLLEVLADHDCCVPHLHLPLQSGSLTILRRMNRQYDAGEYREMIARVGCALDRPAVSTDIVVGFCGETEDDFEQTQAMVRQVGFCKIHAFPFSPREGTAAARWTDQRVDGSVVRDRMTRLRKLEAETARQFREEFVGSVERVLVEPGQTADGSSSPVLLHGRTDRYFEVHFPAPAERRVKPGELVRVRIDRIEAGRVLGTLTSAHMLGTGIQAIDTPSPADIPDSRKPAGL